MSNTMKMILGTLLLVTAMVQAGEIEADDLAMIKESICRMIDVQAQPVSSEALKRVFQGRFFQVKLSRKNPDGSIYGMGKLRMVRLGDRMVFPSDIGTDKSLPVLLEILNPDFSLTTDSDARLMEQALGALYPVHSISDKNATGIRRQGDTWLFVRGKFFDHHKGFVVKTKNGKVTELRYKLKISQ